MFAGNFWGGAKYFFSGPKFPPSNTTKVSRHISADRPGHQLSLDSRLGGTVASKHDINTLCNEIDTLTTQKVSSMSGSHLAQEALGNCGRQR